ncbi:flagellar biosynthesis protein R [Roseibium sp. RKSG952]|uniref:flagellar biosynthesis protein R n=1 Tax=Roseibium sp. RKSG952 TaxID=2529384 RepID=UPI0012BD6DB9|nr:flagellar biosynthesis protein R [Roseibium sp. RKSG952]MTH98274.1 flagellar biosynthesis protein R [Roseibium sp. RKSG952]
MARNSQEIERILRLQKQIYLFSSWLMQKLDSQAHELSEREKRILDALSNGDLAQHDRFIANAAGRLRRILDERSELRDAREKMAGEFARQRQMLRLMEKRLEHVRGIENRKTQDRNLEDLIEIQLRQHA